MSERILIKPESYFPEQRLDAVERATAVGKGVRMEVHSGHTEYFADASVPVGKVAVYCSTSYKAWPAYETTLDSPDQYWEPFAWRTREEQTRGHFEDD